MVCRGGSVNLRVDEGALRRGESARCCNVSWWFRWMKDVVL